MANGRKFSLIGIAAVPRPMDRKDVDTPLGPGTASIIKGVLSHVILERREVGGYMYVLSMLGLFNIAPPVWRRRWTASHRFKPFVERLSDYHAQALDILTKLGFPEGLSFDFARFQLETLGDGFTPEQRAGRVASLSLYAPPHNLFFHVDADGKLAPKLRADFKTRLLPDIEAAHKRAKTAPLKHRVFGAITPDSLTELKRKKLGRRFVSFDLHLADPDLERFTPAALDPFVPLRDSLEVLLPQLIPHLAELRHDWASDWMDPLNADMARAFHKAFPQAFPEAAATGAVAAADFQNAPWLSRVGLQPFAANGPTAIWDFHALPKGRDDTIFVIRTDPVGNVQEVTTES